MWYLYIILAIIVLYVILCAYIKIKFHFWSLQPVFHIYDFMYWIKPPGIINSDLPEINRYTNLLDITTQDIENINDTTATRTCNFINSYYLRSKDTKYMPTKENIMEYFKGSNHHSYLTLYKEPKLLFIKGEPNTAIDDYKAILTGRPLYITLKGKKTFPTYYVDNLCVHPDHRKKGIAPRAIQTHYYNLRKLNKKIKTCLFKREGNMTAIVPLTTYTTIGYELSDSLSDFLNLERLPHASMCVIEITDKNMQLFAEFIQSNVKRFDCVVLPEIPNLLNLIKTNNLYIYGIVEHHNLIAAYVFRNPSVKYDEIHKTLECITTLFTCHHKEIFTTGFNIALQMCRKHINASRLLIENTAHSKDIIDRYKRMNIKIFTSSPTAFFLYNYACYTCSSESSLFLY